MTEGIGLSAPRPETRGEVRDLPRDRGAGPEEVLHDGARYPLVGAQVDLPDGRAWREWTRHPGAVAVVATRPAPGAQDASEVEVYCVRQYRHPVRSVAWEVPAGLLDVPGEPMVEAAARELAEEAGLTASDWATLVDYHTTPGGSAEAIRVFWARGLADVVEDDFEREAEEADMTGHWVPLGALLEALHTGGLHNPSTVIGVLALERVLRGDATARPADAPFELGPVDHR
ncbi:NUDIX domain-containing protein [Kytococcus sp. Marseille-QA3725]